METTVLEQLKKRVDKLYSMWMISFQSIKIPDPELGC